MDSLCEFLEAAVHTVLLSRQLYALELFERQRLYGIFVQKARHPELCAYIGSVLSNLKVRRCKLKYVVSCMLVLSAAQLQQRWPPYPPDCSPCVASMRGMHVQPLLLQDTLQELVVLFLDAQGQPVEKVAFIVQVKGLGAAAP